MQIKNMHPGAQVVVLGARRHRVYTVAGKASLRTELKIGGHRWRDVVYVREHNRHMCLDRLAPLPSSY